MNSDRISVKQLLIQVLSVCALIMCSAAFNACSDDEENPCDTDSACIKVIIPATDTDPERTFWRSAQGRECPCEE